MLPNETASARRAPVFGLILAAVLAAPAAGLGQAAGERFPDDRWMRYENVEQAGFDAAKLAAAQETWAGLPSSAFMVIADGAIVAVRIISSTSARSMESGGDHRGEVPANL